MHLVSGSGRTRPRPYTPRSFFKAWRGVIALAEQCRRERRYSTRNGIRHQMALHAREAERRMLGAQEQHGLLRLRLAFCLTEPQQRILATVALAPPAGYTGELLSWMSHLGQEESTEDPATDRISSLIEKQLVAVARGDVQARIWRIRYLPGPALETCVEEARCALRRREEPKLDLGEPGHDPDVIFLEDFCPPEVVFLDEPDS